MDFFVFVVPNLGDLLESGDNLVEGKDNLVEADFDLSCASIDVYAEAKEITLINAKELECKYRCGLIELESYSNDCIGDKFYCYCK